MMDYFSDEKLVETQPINRAAYSDRTAWIMAEISRLVYEKLPNEKSVNDLIFELREGITNGEYENILSALENYGRHTDIYKNNSIIDELKNANFDFIKGFANDGTEAILIKFEPYPGSPSMIVLAFRGTEKSVKDIRADITCDLVSAPNFLGVEGEGKVHRGFIDAFQKVGSEIKAELAKYDGLGIPIFITGHSLGAALALIATRYLCADSSGATYTFGSPRVGDDIFFRNVRTPVYRVANGADGVTRVPFGEGLSLFLATIRYIPFNGTKNVSEWIRNRFRGYTHYGSLVYLAQKNITKKETGLDKMNLDVKTSPSIFYKSKNMIERIITTSGNAIVIDHSISNYSSLLMQYAKSRNINISNSSTIPAVGAVIEDIDSPDNPFKDKSSS